MICTCIHRTMTKEELFVVYKQAFLDLSGTLFSSVHGTDFWWVLISDAFFFLLIVVFRTNVIPRIVLKMLCARAECVYNWSKVITALSMRNFNQVSGTLWWWLNIWPVHSWWHWQVFFSIIMQLFLFFIFIFAFDRKSIISISWRDDPQIKKSSKQIFTKWQFKSTARSWSKLQEKKGKERKRKMKQTCLYFNIYFRQTNKKDVSVYMYFILLCNKVGGFNHMLNVKVHCWIINTQCVNIYYNIYILLVLVCSIAVCFTSQNINDE